MNMIFLLLLSFAGYSASTPTGIELNSDWKVRLNDYAVKHVVHQSWGYSHAERNYQKTLELAQKENILIDEEIIFAAAFLHDLGGLVEFEIAGIDHAIRSADLARPLLIEIGFPVKKIDAVKEIILGHIYYGPVPLGDGPRLFRDADILDFLGSMGIARILAATPELGSYPTIKNSHSTIEGFYNKLPSKLYFISSQEEAKIRLHEMKTFMDSLSHYSFGGNAF